MRPGALLLLYFLFLKFPLVGQYCGKVEYGLEHGLLQLHLNNLYDSKGRLWVGSYTEGLFLFDGKQWKNFTTKDGLLFNTCHPFLEDKEGGIWIVHRINQGVSRLVNGRFQTFVAPSLAQTSSLKGQKKLPYNSFTQILFYDKKKQAPVTFYQDSTKQFWIYTFNYKTQDFDQREPFFNPSAFSKYGPLMKYKDILKNWFYVDWKGEYFVRISKSNIVNVNRAVSINRGDRTVEMKLSKKNKTLGISDSYYADFLKRLPLAKDRL